MLTSDIATLVMIPFEISAKETSYDTGMVDIPQKSDEPTEIRTRKQVDGLRMYVDEENPLFIIRNCLIWGGSQTGEAFAEYAIKTYNALPEDIGNFAVIYINEGTTDMTPARQLEFWDELLTTTDEAGVPIVCQSECFSTECQCNRLKRCKRQSRMGYQNKDADAYSYFKR